MLVATFFSSSVVKNVHSMFYMQLKRFYFTSHLHLFWRVLFSLSSFHAGIARGPKLAVSTRERLAAQRSRFRHSAQVAKNGMRVCAFAPAFL
jgi:hypothetical protein